MTYKGIVFDKDGTLTTDIVESLVQQGGSIVTPCRTDAAIAMGTSPWAEVEGNPPAPNLLERLDGQSSRLSSRDTLQHSLGYLLTPYYQGKTEFYHGHWSGDAESRE